MEILVPCMMIYKSLLIFIYISTRLQYVLSTNPMTYNHLKNLSLLIVFVSIYSPLLGRSNDRTTSQVNNADTIYNKAEQHAYFPGGGDGFRQFLAKNLQYPELAKQQNIQGTVFIRVIVEKDGTLSEFKILNTPGAILSEEAIRILKLSPKWGPGIQNGKPVRTYFNIPILFNLNNGRLEPPTEKEAAAPPAEAVDSKVYSAVQVNPSFPGGEQDFARFLRENIRYPSEAKRKNVTGRAYIQFIVETDGSLTNFTVPRDPGEGLGDEAVRVLKLSPKWKPGIQNGRPVRVQYTVPINFSF
jgi:TonB family protein